MISENQRIKAIVLTWDPNRAIAEHMMLQYEKLWPSHPFVFHIPYQNLGGTETERTKYIRSPENIKLTVLHLIADLDDEEWIYWCMDDRYPVQLPVDKIARMVSHAVQSPKMSGLLFCRCRRLLKRPKLTLYRREWANPYGDIYLERRRWYQIWIHQLLKVKVLRYLFTRFPERLATGTKEPNAMDKLKHHIVKPPEYRLFVTKENFAVFGESIRGGVITQNCYDSIITTDIELPDRFRQTTGEHVTLGTL
jgi:hypothetical protein